MFTHGLCFQPATFRRSTSAAKPPLPKNICNPDLTAQPNHTGRQHYHSPAVHINPYPQWRKQPKSDPSTAASSANFPSSPKPPAHNTKSSRHRHTSSNAYETFLLAHRVWKRSRRPPKVKWTKQSNLSSTYRRKECTRVCWRDIIQEWA